MKIQIQNSTDFIVGFLLKTKKMLPSMVILGFLLIITNALSANNISVSNVTLTGQNTSTHSYLVQFDISWDNSWRINTGPSNWDAAWVFVKFRLKNNATWFHAIFNYVDGSGGGDGHTEPTNCVISSASDFDSPSGSNGVFIHRSSTMAQGSVTYTGVKLRWDYGEQGFYDNDQFEIKVYAIEMVYVPTSTFMVGDGETIFGTIVSGTNVTQGFVVSSENQITVGTSAGNLYYFNNSSAYGDLTGPIPASFPKGYQRFYCMKYEITQEQYVEFLNSLSRFAQVGRVATNISTGTSSITNRFVMSNTSTMSYRNGIRCDATISTDEPVEFYCDFDGDGVPNESNDGQNIACNFLSWGDLAAYLDWAALRPMTELEYEKACRGGNISPIINEYAWGDASSQAASSSILNTGQTNELSSNYSTASGNYNSCYYGPFRVGIFAANPANTGRISSGGSFYGIMELTGNVYERVVTIGNSDGRAYKGYHGDGLLTGPNSNVYYWPSSTTASGCGIKTNNPISRREKAVDLEPNRNFKFGGRGIRTAP